MSEGKERLSIWLQKYEMIRIATGSNGLQQAQLLITKLRRDARALCSETMEATKWQMNISNLKADLKTRFLSQSKPAITFTPFLMWSNPVTGEQYQTLRKEATFIADEGAMSLIAPAQIIINNPPGSISPLLYLATQDS